MLPYYILDLFAWAQICTPGIYAKTKIQALLRVVVQSISDTYSDWWIWANKQQYFLQHNSQVCYLQKLMNDHFDHTLRRIRIEDGLRYDRIYIYFPDDDKPLFLPHYIQLPSYYADSGCDFKVILNGTTLSADQEIQMRALLDYFKLPSKRYHIIA